MIFVDYNASEVVHVSVYNGVQCTIPYQTLDISIRAVEQLHLLSKLLVC